MRRTCNRHLTTAKEWFPHEYVPWSEGTDFDGPLGGQAWEPGQSKLSEVAQTSLIVNLLTEDNLPSYHHEISTHVRARRRLGHLGAPVDRRGGPPRHRHPGLPARHAFGGPRGVERARMTHMSSGFTNAYADKTSLHGIAYVSFQELATRVSHRNTGKLSGDPVCDQLLAKVAADENLHMLFYRNVLAAAFEITPNDAMRAVTDVVTTFQMPGHGIENFTRKSVQIAMAGIYDLRIHLDEVVTPVLRNINALDTPGLTGDGAKARDELVAFMSELDRAATRFVERREAINARKAS